MLCLNEKAKAIFDKITEGMNMENNYNRIDNSNGAFMPLVVEVVEEHDIGLMFSLAHYYKQNGDLMQDPEMVFLRHKNGEVYPAMFQQAWPPIYEASIFWDEKWKVNPRLQKKHTAFAHQWLINIKMQQNLT